MLNLRFEKIDIKGGVAFSIRNFPPVPYSIKPLLVVVFANCKYTLDCMPSRIAILTFNFWDDFIGCKYDQMVQFFGPIFANNYNLPFSYFTTF